jgi:hypothetical protein
MENNYFRNCKYPMMISMQGTDVYGTGTLRDPTNLGTFSKEDGGMIKAYGNVMAGTYTFIPYGATDIVTAGATVTAASRNITNTNADFDAYVVDDPATTVPGTVVSYQGGNHYSNFDTNGTPVAMYSWTPDTAEAGRDKAILYAGRVEGGDFQWTFDNATDDTGYAVIMALKSALIAYTGTIVSIQGDSADSGTGGDTGGDTGGETGGTTISGAVTCFFSDSGPSNSAFTIAGNYSDSKGTCTVNGTPYTYCLKMESATTITFTIEQEMTLTLVFGGTTTALDKKAKIDGTAYTTVADGVNYTITQTLAAGSHTVTKGDSINLFFISLD